MGAKEDGERAAVVAEVKTWLLTPHMHRQALKGVGVDCGQLPLEAYVAAGVIKRPTVEAYPADWHMNMRQEVYLELVQGLGFEVTREDAKAGDFMIFKWGLTFSHGAILIGGTRIIHALVRIGVVEGDFEVEEFLRSREKKFFRPNRWAHP